MYKRQGNRYFFKRRNRIRRSWGKIVPSAVLVIKDGSSKLISIKDQDGLSRIIDMVPDVVNKFTSKNDVKDDFSDFEEMDEDIND